MNSKLEHITSAQNTRDLHELHKVLVQHIKKEVEGGVLDGCNMEELRLLA
jgi:hypothetical protein